MQQVPCRTQPDLGVPFMAKGEGETILLLHGSTGSAGTWKKTIEALSPLYRVVAPDLTGYGRSVSWSGPAPFTLADEAARIRSLLPCCGKPFHIVGYSYGGVLALHMALTEPARIKSLTLIEPVFFSALRYDDRSEDYDAFLAVRDTFVAELTAGNPASAMRRFIDFWNGAGAWDALAPDIRSQLSSLAGQILQDWQVAFSLDPGPNALWKLADKALLLRGDRSPAPMRQLVDSLAGFIPGTRREIVVGATHLLPLTHGAEMIVAMTGHLQQAADRHLR